MSILDTPRNDLTTVDRATVAPSAITPATTRNRVERPATSSRVARFLSALRHSNLSARDRALLGEQPAIYEEYRASRARHETAEGRSRRS
ncbi:MAG: hypothetical protein HIU57_01540 [Acidobacteria bacterium]|nr:hypothetical protein [Acidobacteriota bacterium]